MKKELKEKWLELYKVADEIKSIEPWVNLADNNILGYIDEETGQIVYFCIMGNAGIHKGIGVYRGKEGIGLFETLAENFPFPIAINYQSCLKLNYSLLNIKMNLQVSKFMKKGMNHISFMM